MTLRREGHTCEEIASIVGGDLNEAKVQYMIEQCLKRYVEPATEHVRKEELDRLDRLYNKAFRVVEENGQDRIPALNSAINVMKRRSELLGLDAPKKVDLKDERTNRPTATAISDFVDGLAKANGFEPGDEDAGSRTTH